MKAIIVLFGIVLLLASFWAGQYIVYCCKDEWYAVSAIVTVWVVRLFALTMIIGPMQEEKNAITPPMDNTDSKQC